MYSRAFASVISLLLLSSGAQAPQDGFAPVIEYPVADYKLENPDPLRKVRTGKVKALRQRLSATTSAELLDETAEGGSSVATDLRLTRVVPPIRILWNDPRYLFRAPATVEWIELVDETGKITRVWVTASNQTRRDDRRIINWCTNVSLRASPKTEGRFVLRSAGVTLVGSRYHYSSLPGALGTPAGKIIALALLALLAWMVARILDFRQREKLRREQLLVRLHRSTPFKPPSVDDER